MKFKNKFSNEEFDVVVFDGTQYEAVLNEETENPNDYLVQMNSPSGELVQMNIVPGTYVIEKDNCRYCVSPYQFSQDFEEITVQEVTNG